MGENTWDVLEHGPLERLADNLWRVEGALPNMGLRRNMIVARRGDGGLVIHNGIATDDDVRGQIEALGPPRDLVVPNAWHRLDAPAYVARYPELKVYCPAGARKGVEKKVKVDGTYDDYPADDAVRFEHLDGLRRVEGVMFVRSDDGVTAVFNDAVFNHPHMGGFAGFVVKLLGSTGGPRVSGIARVTMVKDKAAYRAHLLRIADLPDLVRIAVGHVEVIDDDAPRVLREVAARL